jgi:molecular chaperone HtpG
MAEKGGISVQTEHIFPIIKRWLYSDKEIFLREIVSNAADAETKLKHLVAIGQATGIDGDYRIDVTVDKNAKTITVEDNGIGMTEDEVKQYINQIALSGALDFIQKYENASSDGIIGHFGLGFYSSFMVADRVELDTKSHTGAPAVHWVCNQDGEFEMSDSEKKTRGTKLTLHVTDEEQEFLDGDKLKGILTKYCGFLPFPIYFTDACAEKKEEEIEEKPVNDVEPLWQKMPNECTDEDYDAFYHKVFWDNQDPLFHIHINADYPLNFKGILYFPRLGNEYRSLEGEVKLFYNRVFVSDNIKEVLPDYLLMLKGVLDCPELPLNVSRSYLQDSDYVKKVSAHIVKKVCDKLAGLHNTDLEKYQSFWDDIKIFVEYGCIKDKKY